MNNSKGWIIAITIGSLISSFSTAKAEHTRRNNGTLGGTFLSTRMDLNDDGVLATWSTAEVSGTLGKRTVQGIVETVPTGPTPECPNSVVIIDAQNKVGFSTITATFPNGDQVYSRILTRTQCGLGGGKLKADDVQEIIGGTGKFEGASGTVEVHSISQCQGFDANAVPPQCFGSFTGEFTGTITLP
jgi:hypothetical protein